MNEYSILMLSKIYRQEAIQQADAVRLVRRGRITKAIAQPRRVNVLSIALRLWTVWAHQIRLGMNWLRPRPLALQKQPDC